MKPRLRKVFAGLLILLYGVIFSAGCKKADSSPVGPETQSLNPAGWVISDFSQKPLLVIWQGTVQKSWNGAPVNDTLPAMLHEISGHLIIKYIDNNKSVLDLPEDSTYRLSWNIADTTLLNVFQHGSTGFFFHLRGLREGVTSLQFKITPQGSPELNLPAFPVAIKKDPNLGDPVAVLLVNEDNNEIFSVSTSTDSSGLVEVNSGNITDHIRIEFNDANGKEFQPDYTQYSYTTAMRDTSIAEILPVSGEPWTIRIKGLKKGLTSFILKLYNGNNLKFTSAPIQISVK